MEEDSPEEGEVERAVVVEEEGDTHVDVGEGETEAATVAVVVEVIVIIYRSFPRLKKMYNFKIKTSFVSTEMPKAG